MSKKITITLSDKAEQYLAKVMYGLEMPNPKKEGEFNPATQSYVINESLESLFDFEDVTDDCLVNWLETKYQVYSKRKQEKDEFINKGLELVRGLNSRYDYSKK